MDKEMKMIMENFRNLSKGELGGAVRGVDADELDDRGNLIDDENAGIFGSLT
jgi:hypothetical protein